MRGKGAWRVANGDGWERANAEPPTRQGGRGRRSRPVGRMPRARLILYFRDGIEG